MLTAPEQPDDGHTRITPRGFYIPSLDGIRAAAFMAVFLAHSFPSLPIPGSFGVTVFFFLSGFLITTLLRREYEQHESINFKSFYIRRTLRIFPPMYITLIFTSLATLGGILHVSLQPGPLLAQILHLTNYAWIIQGSPEGMPQGSGVMWSLAIEEHFYLAFPLLIFICFSRISLRQTAAILASVCILLLLWRCYLKWGLHVSSQRLWLGTDTRFDSILFGCILATWHSPCMDPPIRFTRKTKLIAYLLPLGILLTSFVTFLYRDYTYRYTITYTIQGITLIPLFYLAVIDHEKPWMKPLNWRWVRFLGVLSYTLYLVHGSAIYVFRNNFVDLPTVLVAAFALTISVIYATAMYYSIERPLAKIRKRLHSTKKNINLQQPRQHAEQPVRVARDGPT